MIPRPNRNNILIVLSLSTTRNRFGYFLKFLNFKFDLISFKRFNLNTTLAPGYNLLKRQTPFHYSFPRTERNVLVMKMRAWTVQLNTLLYNTCIILRRYVPKVWCYENALRRRRRQKYFAKHARLQNLHIFYRSK